MWKSKKKQSKPADSQTAPTLASGTVMTLPPRLPSLPSVTETGALAPSEQERLREEAVSRAVELLASRDPLSDPSERHRHSAMAPWMGDALGAVLGVEVISSGTGAVAHIDVVGDADVELAESLTWTELGMVEVPVQTFYDAVVAELGFDPASVCVEAVAA